MCNNNGTCLIELLEKILILQQVSTGPSVGCNKPFLGNNQTDSFNTRPIQLYCCCTNALWEMPYTNQGTTANTSTFRVESINENTATFRLLIQNDNGFTATNDFFTIDLKYISCIKCLNDVFINI